MANSIGPVHDFYKILPEQYQTLRLSNNLFGRMSSCEDKMLILKAKIKIKTPIRGTWWHCSEV